MAAWTGDQADAPRGGRPTSARNIGVAVAKRELQQAEQAVLAARAAVQVAKAEALAARAERLAGRATLRDVLEAQRRHSNAKRAVRASVAAVQARRANVDLARLATRGDPSTLPLAQVVAAHEAVTTRWLAYETDAAKLIAFPAMTDVRQPRTAAFVDRQRVAIELRPARDARITAEQFLAYRDAVAALQTAFAEAEQEAGRLAREESALRDRALQERRADEARQRHAEARALAEAERQAAEQATVSERATADDQHPSPPATATQPVWPIPSRSRSTPPPH